MKTENAAATLCLTTAMALVVMLCAHAPIAHSLPTSTAQDGEPQEIAILGTEADPDYEARKVAVDDTERQEVTLEGSIHDDESKGLPDTVSETVIEGGRARDRRAIASDECLDELWLYVHTSLAEAGGKTSDQHNIELQLDIGTYTASLDSTPDGGEAPSTIGAMSLWKMSFQSDFGLSCVNYPDINSIALVASDNDGWLIDFFYTELKGNYGGFRWLTKDAYTVSSDGVWIDTDASSAQTGNNYDANRRTLTKRPDWCQ